MIYIRNIVFGMVYYCYSHKHKGLFYFSSCCLPFIFYPWLVKVAFHRLFVSLHNLYFDLLLFTFRRSTHSRHAATTNPCHQLMLTKWLINVNCILSELTSRSDNSNRILSNLTSGCVVSTTHQLNLTSSWTHQSLTSCICTRTQFPLAGCSSVDK